MGTSSARARALRAAFDRIVGARARADYTHPTRALLRPLRPSTPSLRAQPVRKNEDTGPNVTRHGHLIASVTFRARPNAKKKKKKVKTQDAIPDVPPPKDDGAVDAPDDDDAPPPAALPDDDYRPPPVNTGTTEEGY